MFRRIVFSVCMAVGVVTANVQEVQAQEAPIKVRPYQDTIPNQPKAPWYKSKVFKATAVPVVLIGYGLSTVGDNGIYSSHDAKDDIQGSFSGFSTKVDDALLVAPYVELALVNMLNVKSDHDFLNTSLLILKSEAIMLTTVYGLKKITNVERPNGENRESFPSGHTAQAFLAASIVHNELKHKSDWYGVGAYTIAAGVGAFRMLNDKHWQADVFAGAGIGILSAHLAYLTHRNRWGRQPFSLMPTYQNGAVGVSFVMPLN
ncbi:MAG: phosphatase PAP2 family protein [Hymenobacteraceae bacterium]|nr:phosphatase PAP2 family protein [Hymenobacteraceae bacterium]